MGQAIANSRKVLVVEDEPLIRLQTILLVESLGHIALEAESADEAITLLEVHDDVSVVFTDINMAGSMDGLALAVYAYDRWPPLQFIIVSGAERPKVSDMPEGARFFAKPFSAQAVSSALQAMIDNANDRA